MIQRSHVEGVGAIVLASAPRDRGGAPRAGGPATGVQEAVRAAVDAGLWPVVVVIEASAELLRGALAGLPVVTCTGGEPGGALRAGLSRLAECAPAARAMVLLRCDRPAPDAAHLGTLAAAADRERKPIAASARAGALDVPALFSAALFAELLRAGDGRALLADPARVAVVEVP